MRHIMVLATTMALAAVAGCQTSAPAQPARHCFDRPFDAGRCEQPTNFRLFDFLVRGG